MRFARDSHEDQHRSLCSSKFRRNNYAVKLVVHAFSSCILLRAVQRKKEG